MALTRPVVAKTETNEAVEAAQTEALTVEGVAETAATAEVASAPVQEQKAEAAQAEQVVAEAEAAPAQAQAPAVAQSGGAVAQARTNAMAEFAAAQAEAGFEGMNLTSMSFDRIKLHEGKFLLGSDEAELGTEFDCIIHSTRKIYVIRQSTDNDAESFYSYDPQGKTFTDGSSAEEKLQEWAEDGYGTEDSPLDIREYLEATATLVDRDDEYEDQMVMLSIPPASAARFAGAAAQAFAKFNRALLSDVVTRCSVGKKIGEGQKAFRPWVPKVLRRI